MARERLYRMTEIQRNMLVVALMDEYRKQKARGVPYLCPSRFRGQ